MMDLQESRIAPCILRVRALKSSIARCYTPFAHRLDRDGSYY